jgi:hypothetical protein
MPLKAENGFMQERGSGQQEPGTPVVPWLVLEAQPDSERCLTNEKVGPVAIVDPKTVHSDLNVSFGKVN